MVGGLLGPNTATAFGFIAADVAGKEGSLPDASLGVPLAIGFGALAVLATLINRVFIRHG